MIYQDLKDLEATGTMKAQLNSAAAAFLTEAVSAGVPLPSLIDAGKRKLQDITTAPSNLSDIDFVKDLNFEYVDYVSAFIPLATSGSILSNFLHSRYRMDHHPPS